MVYKRIAMLELAHDRPAPFPTDEFDSFNRQIHRYAAQVEEQTNRNLYILTMFSAIFLPATLIAGIWGMNVGGIPFKRQPERLLGSRRADGGVLRHVRDRNFAVCT